MLSAVNTKCTSSKLGTLTFSGAAGLMYHLPEYAPGFVHARLKHFFPMRFRAGDIRIYITCLTCCNSGYIYNKNQAKIHQHVKWHRLKSAFEVDAPY